MNSDVGGTLRYVIKADTSDFDEGMAKAEKTMHKVAADFKEQGTEAGSGISKGIQNGTAEATSSIAKFAQESLSELKEFASSTASVLGNLATTFSGMGVTTLTAWASKGITDTQFLEDTQIQLQALTHSTELGSKAMAEATKYFKNNPFNRFDVTDATKQLIQFGATIDEVPSLLEKMGNVSLSTGVKINELARVYQQASADGKVGLLDIEKLAARGVPIWDAFAKATGKSAAAIREETRSGGVAVEDFKKAFDYLVDEEAMAQNEKTFSRQLDRFKGRMSNMKAALAGYSMDYEKGLIIDEKGLYRSVTNLMKVFSDTMSSGIGDKLLAALTKLAGAISPYIDKLAEKVPSVLDKIATFIDKIADHTEMLIPILAGAGIMFGKLATGIPGLDRIIGPLGSSIGDMAKKFGALNPLMKIFVAILGAGAIKALTSGELNGAIKTIVESLGKLAQALAPVIARIAEIMANVGSKVIVASVTALAKVLEVLANVINAIPEPILTGLVTALLGFLAIQKVVSPIKEATGALGGLAKATSSVGKTSAAGSGVGNLVAGILKPLGNNDVLKGAASVTLVAVGFYIFAEAIGRASEISINVGNLLGMVVAIGLLSVIMGIIGKFAVNIAFGAIAETLVGVSLMSLAVGLQMLSQTGANIDFNGLLIMSGAIVIVSAIMGVLGLFAEFIAIGAIATAVVGVGLMVAAVGIREASKMGAEIDMGGILTLSAAIAETAILMTALLLFTVFGSVGAIAAATIGVGLAITAAGLKFASEEGKKIDMGGILLLMSAVTLTSVLLTSILALSVLGAVSAVATSIIGVGLAVAAFGIKSASQNGKEIDFGGLGLLMDAVAFTSLILTAILALSLLGSVSAVATTVIGGGLALTAVGLKAASETGRQIDFVGLEILSEAIVLTSTILALILPFSAMGAVSSIATSIIGGGLVLTAKGLLEASEISAKIKPQNLFKLTQALTYIAELQTGNIFSNLHNMVNTGVLTKVADNIKTISETLVNIPTVRTSSVKKIKEAIAEFASISTGDIWSNLQNLFNSDMLAVVSYNVRYISSALEGIKPIKKDNVTKIREAVEEFSKIKIEGNGLFENKGEASAQLVTVARNIARVTSLLSVIATDDLLDNLNTFEKAISRDGKGWPINWAEDFVAYINKLSGATSNLRGIDAFILRVSVWDTESLLEKFNQFEKAVSRDGKSWEPWYAEQFKKYIDKLVGDMRSFDLVDEFINKVSAWKASELLTQFNDFEKAISRDGKAWEPWYAGKFMEYINKLTENMRSFDLVDSFINKVSAWKSHDLLNTFNDFEKAISRDGKSWEPWYAEQFIDYIKKLVGDNGTFDRVDEFINKVVSWNTHDLITQFNDFEKAISRDGKSWEPWYADQFSKYIQKLTTDSKSLELVDMFIARVSGWDTANLLTRFNQFEDAVSRHGEGWPMTWASQFINYINKLTGDGASFEKISNFIENVKVWATDDLKTQFDKFENAVSRGGKGWSTYWSNQFGNYVKSLTTDGNLENVSNFIDKVSGWATDNLKTQFDTFENAVSRGGKGWPKVWADQFSGYIKQIASITGSLDSVDQFVTKVKSWTADGDFKPAFDTFENAVSRGGNGWPKVWADQLVAYINKLTEVNGSLDLINNFIEKTKGWTSGEISLLTVFNNFEKAISRDGQGWPINWATDFVNWMVKIGEAQESGAMEALGSIIPKALEIQSDTTVATKFNELEKIVSNNGAGYPLNWAEGFVDYWNEFNNLTYNFESIKKYIETVSGLSPENVAANVKLIVDSIGDFVTAAESKTPVFYTTGGQYADNIYQGWADKNILDKFEKQISSLTKKLSEYEAKFQAIGTNFANNIVNSFNNGGFYNAGANATAGFANGLNSAVWRVNAAMGNISAAAVNTLRKLLNIHSPSKVMFGLGENTGEGLVRGLEDQIEDVKSAAEEIANAIRQPFEELNNMQIGVDGNNMGNNQGLTKYLTINQNNNINNGMDYSTMMADLKWELFTA